MDHHTVAVALRWMHVAAMAVMLGGATLVLALALDRAATAASLTSIARRYERLFWAALGVAAMTGVGNLGAIGRALPAAETAWGTTLAFKLALIMALALASVPRSLLVAGTRPLEPRLAQRLYGATVAGLVVIAGLANALAHG